MKCDVQRYKWIMEGVQLSDRVKFFEERIPYFSGFGAPLTCIVLFSPNFVSTGVYALIFPMFIIQAIESKPIHHLSANYGNQNQNQNQRSDHGHCDNGMKLRNGKNGKHKNRNKNKNIHSQNKALPRIPIFFTTKVTLFRWSVLAVY